MYRRIVHRLPHLDIKDFHFLQRPAQCFRERLHAIPLQPVTDQVAIIQADLLQGFAFRPRADGHFEYLFVDIRKPSVTDVAWVFYRREVNAKLSERFFHEAKPFSKCIVIRHGVVVAMSLVIELLDFNPAARFQFTIIDGN